MSNKTYVALISSLHPIEIASIVMNHAYRPFGDKDKILLLVDEDIEIPSKMYRRVLTPRLSMPTPLLLFESNSSIYRQVFLPLFNDDLNTNLESVLVSARLLIDRITGLITPENIALIRQRVESLTAHLTVQKSIADSSSLISEILSFVLRDILRRDVSVQSYSELLYSPLGQERCVRAIMRIINEILHEKGKGDFSFIKGGYIEVLNIDGERIGGRIEKGRFEGEMLELRDNKSKIYLRIQLKQKRQNIRLYLQNSDTLINDYVVSLRGPLVMAFLSQIGTPIDTPWYYEEVSDAIKSWSACIGIEAISPISTSSRQRSSSWVGGANKRLVPSGYSLIDFDHPNTLSFAAAIANLGQVDKSTFDDWRHLVDNYPTTKQKALKHQGGVSEYCHLRRHEIRSLIKSGSSIPIESILDVRYLSPAFIGLRILHLMSVIKYISDCEATPEIQWSVDQLYSLKSLGFIRMGVVALDAISRIAFELIERSVTWRYSIAVPSSIVHELDESNTIQLVQAIADNNAKKPDEVTTREDYSIMPLRKIYRMLEEEAEMYYKAVLAIVASLLKANIWYSWLLLGPADYISICQSILNNRQDKKVIKLSARLWD